MTKKRFTLMARVSTEDRQAIKRVLEELVAKRAITSTDEGFLVKGTLPPRIGSSLSRNCRPEGQAIGASPVGRHSC
jgi:ribosomal protein S3AE